MGAAMFRVAFSLALVLPVALVGPALSQGSSSAEQTCFDRRTDQPGDLQNRIAACSAVIDNGELRADVRAEGLLRRAMAYAEKAAQSDSKDDMDRAILDLSKGMQLDPDNRAAQKYAYRMRAGLYFHKGDHDLALADYTALIRLEPNSATVHEYRGVVYAAKGAHEQAIADYSEAIRLEPKVARVHNQRAWSYLQVGKIGEALADADRAVSLDPGDSASYSARVVINRGLGKHNEVINDLRKALSLDPTNDGIRQELQLAEAAQPTTRQADNKGAEAKEIERVKAELRKTQEALKTAERERQVREAVKKGAEAKEIERVKAELRKAQEALKTAERERQAALEAAEEARWAATQLRHEAEKRLAEPKAQQADRMTEAAGPTPDPTKVASAPVPESPTSREPNVATPDPTSPSVDKAIEAKTKKASERIAALPKVETPKARGQFDGVWTVSPTADPGKCSFFAPRSFTLRIANGVILGRGTVSPSGAASWIGRAPKDGAPVRFNGTFRHNMGSGRFTRTTDARCSGSFTTRRQ